MVQNTSVSKGSMIQMMDIYSRDFSPSLSGNDNETRPANMYMDYIIKTHNTKSRRAADLLAGSVFPFSGADDKGPSGDIDAQYLLCNGDNVVRSRYPDLWASVDKRFTVGKQGVDSFTTPDLRGLFIRGIDDFGLVDPDYQVRKAAPDGTSDGRGTTQGWATKLPNPRYTLNALNQTNGSSSGCTKAAGVTGIASGEWKNDAAISGGDDETRPFNVAMRFYLNTVAPNASQQPNIPIGGIIGLPGLPDATVKKTYDRDFASCWLKCDGSWVNKSDYPALAELFHTTLWNYADSGDQGKFRLPSLGGNYIRGAGNGRATASRQDWATGKPPKLNNEPLGNWPHDCYNIARGGGNRIWDATGNRTFDIQADWDNETAPASVVVEFYVRASYTYEE